jgi:hypothetical protein
MDRVIIYFTQDMAAALLTLEGTPQSRLASDYLNCKFRTIFGIELQENTLNWDDRRLKDITEEMTVMEQLKNLIFDANRTHKFASHNGI